VSAANLPYFFISLPCKPQYSSKGVRYIQTSLTLLRESSTYPQVGGLEETNPSRDGNCPIQIAEKATFRPNGLLGTSIAGVAWWNHDGSDSPEARLFNARVR